jgi:hypothetical protein
MWTSTNVSYPGAYWRTSKRGSAVRVAVGERITSQARNRPKEQTIVSVHAIAWAIRSRVNTGGSDRAGS